MLELKSTHTPGLISAPAMRGTETHKRISESTINTIKNPAMLRARLHLLSHKESLVLSGKQKKINFLIFIDRCGHGAKAALGAYAGPVWRQSDTDSTCSLPSCNGKQPLLIPRVTNPNHRVVYHVALLPLSHSRPLTCIKQWALFRPPS